MGGLFVVVVVVHIKKGKWFGKKQEQQKQILKFIKKNKLFDDVCSYHQVVGPAGKAVTICCKTLKASFIRSFLFVGVGVCVCVCFYGCPYGCFLEQTVLELFICIF